LIFIDYNAPLSFVQSEPLPNCRHNSEQRRFQMHLRMTTS